MKFLFLCILGDFGYDTIFKNAFKVDYIYYMHTYDDAAATVQKEITLFFLFFLSPR